MKKLLIVLLHLWFWVVFFFLMLVVLYARFGERESFAGLESETAAEIYLRLILLPALISFYGFYFWLFPRYFRRQRFVATVAYGTLLAGLTAAVSVLWFVADFRDTTVPGLQELSPYAIGGWITFLNLLCGTVALVIQGFSTWFDEVAAKEALLQKNQAIELALIKSQLDPHFLFNTINNIDVLILKEPAQASDYLNRLSDIMRFMLYETKSELIPLQRELDYLEKYVALQRIRTANPEYVRYAVEGDPAGRQIVPMVFIPLVENAFKHATNKKVPGAIDIDIRVEPDELVLQCRNQFDAGRPADTDTSGLGNELIGKRLALLYPGRHTLTVDRLSAEYRVVLRIKDGV